MLLNVGRTFYDVQNQTGFFVRVEVDHVAQRAVRQSRTEDWDVVLKQEGVS